MTQLASIDPKIKTMTSREIAELTGKAHKNVLADIRELLGALGLAVADFSAAAQVPGPNNSTRTIEVINLPKRECLILVSGYSIAMRARIIDRWQELEDQVAQPALPALPRTFAEALRALADKTEQAERQAALLIEQAPAVAAQALLAGADGSMCITNAAKALHQRPKDLFAWLSAHRWIYKRAGSTTWVGYQDRIQSGLVEHKTTTVERSDGSEKVIEQVLVTAKGLDRLSKAFAVEVFA